MFEELTAAIEDLDVPADPDSLVRAIALRDQLEARIAGAVGAFEAAGWWLPDASASMTAWLKAHARMTGRSASALRSMALRLRSLPVCARAYADGTLSGGRIEAIVARLDDELLGSFSAQEGELIPYLVPLTVAGVSRAMAAWLTRARPEPAEPKEPERSLHLSRTLDDRWVVDGALGPEAGAVVAAAVRLAMADQTDPPGSLAAQRADALVDVCRFFLDHQRGHAGGRHRPHVNVVVELDDLEAGRGGSEPRRRDGRKAVLLQRRAPGRDGRLLVGPRLRHLHSHHPHSALERSRHPRPALPFPRLRPAIRMVRGPSRGVGHPGRPHRPGQTRPGLHPPPSPAPSARLARQAPPGWELRGHRSKRSGPMYLTAARRIPVVMVSRGTPVARHSAAQQIRWAPEGPSPSGATPPMTVADESKV